MELNEALRELASRYGLPGDVAEHEKLVNGHINRTYRVKTTDGGEYIFQQVNTYVFREPIKVMKNIKEVSRYLAQSGCAGECAITDFLDNTDGLNYTVLEDGGFWRVSPFVANSIGYEHVERPSVLYNAGYAFGGFLNSLADMPTDSLYITIPDFHNTKKRLADFFETVEANPLGRAAEVKEEIAFFADNRQQWSLLTELEASGVLPTRVVHNDTKYNNILIDLSTDTPLCVIDLDTIMPGLAAHDFGDAIRFAANTALEDEVDLSKVSLNIDYYERFTSGFIKGTRQTLTDAECEYLAVGAPIITVELASRFLADYINGDKYFAVHRPGHNLDRARCQIALAKDMMAKLPVMKDIVMRHCQ